MSYYIEVSVQARDGIPTDQFDSVFDAVADALYDCTGIHDADLAGDESQSALTFSMVVEADDPPTALQMALSAARTALHATGGATPGWESGFDFLRQTIEKQNSKELVSA